MSDPFRPHRPATARRARSSGDGLDALPKAELVARAEALGLPTSGTRPELAARIRASQ